MKNYKGEERKIGVELEFHGLTPMEAGNLLSSVLGGEVQALNLDEVDVDTPYGKYRLETDARFLKDLSKSSAATAESDSIDFQGEIREALSGLSKEFVPTELVSPPLEIADLPQIDKIQRILVEAGAVGTSDSIRFAFGAQLNPEIRSKDAKSILRTIKSFMILTVWLKSQIQIDLTRVLTSFAGDFPKDYIKHVFSGTSSNFDLDQLIDDYLSFNPTRNRSLDMLPLFAFFNEDKVRLKVPSQKINKRPTYHYRLPNSQISTASWSIQIEWMRWQIVEKLADSDEVFFNQVSERFIDFVDSKISEKTWLMDLNNYVEALR